MTRFDTRHINKVNAKDRFLNKSTLKNSNKNVVLTKYLQKMCQPNKNGNVLILVWNTVTMCKNGLRKLRSLWGVINF